jgi:hypothetical protein
VALAVGGAMRGVTGLAGAANARDIAAPRRALPVAGECPPRRPRGIGRGPAEAVERDGDGVEARPRERLGEPLPHPRLERTPRLAGPAAGRELGGLGRVHLLARAARGGDDAGDEQRNEREERRR